MTDPVLIPAVISLAFSGVIGIISQLQHSKCTHIACCGIFCRRKVDNDDAAEGDKPEV